MLRTAVAAALIGSMACAYAGLSPAPKLTSCVGTQYLALNRERPGTTLTVDAVCLTSNSLRVCRRLLTEEDSNNETTELTVESNGQVIQKWNESSDPRYLSQIHVFRAIQESTLLIVATQQSESQGMGIQEWSVNTIAMDKYVRHTYSTTEFGPQGSLVLDKANPSSKSCSLLSTHWATQSTRQGDRLFLIGKLIDLDTGIALSSTLTKRFDRKLKLQRESAPADRPLRYFQN